MSGRGAPRWVLPAAVAAVVFLVGAGLVTVVTRRDQPDSGPALVVDGWSLSTDELLDEAKQIDANRAYRDGRSAAAGAPFEVFTDTGEVDPGVAAELLNERVSFRLVAEELRRRGLAVTDADRARATELLGRNQVEAQAAAAGGGGDATGEPAAGDASPGTTVPTAGASSALGLAVLSGFGSYGDVLLEGLAGVLALQRALAGDVDSEEALRAAYDRAGDSLQVACVTHVLARAGAAPVDPATGTPPNPTEAELAEARTQIDAAKARIDAGEPIAQVARDVSEDPPSQARDGDLLCRTRGSYATAFDEAVWTLPVGQVSEPVQTPFGWHLIEVRERRKATFEEVREQLAADARDQAGQAFQAWLSDAARRANVSVAPRFGRWDPSVGAVVTTDSPTLSLGPAGSAPVATR